MQQEQNYLGDLLKYEAPNLYSREEIMVEQGQRLALGTIVVKDSNDLFKALIFSGKVDAETLENKASKPKPSNDSFSMIGIIANNVDATNKATKAVVIARHAILADHAVIWPDSITSEQKKLILSQLESRGLIIRKSV